MAAPTSGHCFFLIQRIRRHVAPNTRLLLDTPTALPTLCHPSPAPYSSPTSGPPF